MIPTLRQRLAALLRIPFVRDVGIMQVGVLVAFACGFISSIAYARLLGLEGYGRYAVVMAFAGLFGFLTNLGQQQTTMTFFAEAHGRGDKPGMTKALRYFGFSTAVTWILHGLLIVAYPWLSQLIYGDPRIGELARLISVASMIDPVFNLTAIVLQVLRRIKLLTFLQNLQTIIQVVGSVVLLVLGFGVASILLSSIIGSIVLAVVSFIIYGRMRRAEGLPDAVSILSLRPDRAVWGHLKDGFWIALDKNLGRQYPGLFLFLLSLSAPVTVVGLVRLAFKLADLPATFGLGSVSNLASSVLPQLMSASPDRSWSLVKRLLKHTVALHLGLTVAAMIVIPPLVPYVYGEAFRVVTAPLLIILATHLVLALYVLITPILRVRSKVWIGTALNTVATLGGALIVAVAPALGLRPTFSLYAAVLFYHAVNVLIVFPAWRLVHEPWAGNDRAVRS